ncbi:MAG TPA: sugar phosphate nucleotidyltransferase [Candidatus Magasanikbacteria bacterium]|nr:sugar phosphate nucleotidyltransferase [Candidatus Magasanikbacteria bacterium]
MNAIILCGGLSTRLKDITKSIPKVLLEIKGKTVLDWQLEKIKELGIEEVILAAGHLSEVLKNTVGEERNGVKLIYAIEKERLGTGGAIKYAFSHLKNPHLPTFVLNGDILTGVNLREMLTKLNPDKEGILMGARVENASSYGTLIFNEQNNLLEFREKEGREIPGYINGGIYLFTRKAHLHFPEDLSNFSVEYDVFPKMKELDVYTFDGDWIDIGVPERLEWARQNWNDQINPKL